MSNFTQPGCKSTYFCETGKIFFAGWNIIRTFALAFESESCKQEKHCNIVLLSKSAKFQEEGSSILLSLDCVCYIPIAYLQA